jgi:nitroimidazol reductase NimA-like FMN-containing flavoprotein (pyridoxamine 5'-phosphate oxidase superfamily)
MRRSDREITDLNEIYEVMKQCDVCNIAFYQENYPYIVPLNFGVAFESGTFRLYFHAAKEGTKLELMKKNNHVAFSMDHGHNLVMGDNGTCTMEYESVCGNGILNFLPEEKKVMALDSIMGHYRAGEEHMHYPEQVMKMTEVLELTVNEITGKRRKKMP